MSPQSLLDRIGDWSAGLRYGLLTVIALAFFLPGLFSLPPIDRDESRFAQASKQMVETGDYIDIRFQGEPRHKKPAGIYWAQVLAVHATGIADAIWVYRLPSLLAAVASVLLTAFIGGLLFTGGVGFGAGLVMANSILLNVEARTGKSDALLLASILGALACLLVVLRRQDSTGRGSTASAHGFWALAGAGFMVKGPILFLPLVGIAIAQGWLARGLGWVRDLKPLTGIPLFLAVALPWYVAIIVISDGGFLAESVGKDMIAKVQGGQESHGAPPGLYLALANVTFWPFSFLGLLALPWIWRSRRRSEVLLLLGWALFTWIVFALTPTKLAHYVLPAYPALAILAVAALQDVDATAPRWWRVVVMLLWGLVTLALAGVMPFVADGAGVSLSPWHFAGILLLPALWFGLGFLWGTRQSGAQLLGILVTAGLFSGIVFGRFLPGLEPAFVAPRLAETFRQVADCPQPRLISAGFNEPSLVFLTATDTYLTHAQGAAAKLLDGTPCQVAAIEARLEGEFLDHVGASGAEVEKLDEVQGFNYAKGQRVNISLYRLREPGN